MRLSSLDLDSFRLFVVYYFWDYCNFILS